MLEDQIPTPENPASERPDTTPEQIRAFRGAYSSLTQFASGEHSYPVLIVWDKENNQERIRSYNGPRGSNFDSNANELFVRLPDQTTEGWMHAYSEQLSSESGLLATFTIITSREPGHSARELYCFYPDGNVELRHWENNDPQHRVMKYARDQMNTLEDVYEHAKWLNTTETEQLAITIERCSYLPHVEPV